MTILHFYIVFQNLGSFTWCATISMYSPIECFKNNITIISSKGKFTDFAWKLLVTSKARFIYSQKYKKIKKYCLWTDHDETGFKIFLFKFYMQNFLSSQVNKIGTIHCQVNDLLDDLACFLFKKSFSTPIALESSFGLFVIKLRFLRRRKKMFSCPCFLALWVQPQPCRSFINKEK